MVGRDMGDELEKLMEITGLVSTLPIEHVRAVHTYTGKILAGEQSIKTQISHTETKKMLSHRWLREPDDLGNSANVNNALSNVPNLSTMRAQESTCFINGALKKKSALEFIQFLILNNCGAIKFGLIYRSLKTWYGGNDSDSKSEVKEATFRTWLSQWRKAGFIEYLEDQRGVYTITEKEALVAIRKNPLLKDFDLERQFPSINRVDCKTLNAKPDLN
jgi:hypothetical protein